MALDAGVMHVTLEYGKDLKNRDWFGRQDPYCVMQCGAQKFRSKTHVNGARNPVWNETFQFQVVNENNLQITVYDEDTGSRDDLIGTAGISFARAREQGSDQLNVPVLSSHGKQHGFICVRLRFESNNQLKRFAAPQQPAYMPQPVAYMAAPPPYPYAMGQQPVMYAPQPMMKYPQYPAQPAPYGVQPAYSTQQPH